MRLTQHIADDLRQGNVVRSTWPTAQKAIDSLVDEGILTEVTGRKRNRVYLSPRIMDAVYGLPDDATSDVEG